MEKVETTFMFLKRCVLLAGDSGLGKSSSAICVLENYGYHVYEFNASDIRTQSEIHESLFNLIHIKQIKHDLPPAIIIDEIDGIAGPGLAEIMKYINPDRGKGNRRKEDREKRVPIPPMICICNNVTERKLIDFRKDCLELTFTKASDQNLTTLLNRICKAEKIKLDAEAKELVIEYSQQDYRRLVNYLQSLDKVILKK